MRLDNVRPFLGIPYNPKDMDCADFVLHVQQHMFGRTVDLPGRTRDKRRFLQIAGFSSRHLEPTDTPKDGDVVLMFEKNQHRAGHIGMYAWLDYQPWVLHNNSLDGASVLTRVRDLNNNGLKLEGFYAWRTN